MRIIIFVYAWFYLFIEHCNQSLGKLKKFSHTSTGASAFTFLTLFFPIFAFFDSILAINLIEPKYFLIVLIIFLSGFFITQNKLSKIDIENFFFQKVKKKRDKMRFFYIILLDLLTFIGFILIILVSGFIEKSKIK